MLTAGPAGPGPRGVTRDADRTAPRRDEDVAGARRAARGPRPWWSWRCWRGPSSTCTGGPRRRSTAASKIPWLILCLLLQPIGPIVYLAVGRERPAPAAETLSPGAAVPPPLAAPRAETSAVVDALFAGPARGPDGAASSGPAVELGAVRKAFGDAVALDGLTLSVPDGSVYGFLGPNGAGKTTTLRILAGLAHADAGVVRILGPGRRRRRGRRAQPDRLPPRRARLLQVDDGARVPALRRQPVRPLRQRARPARRRHARARRAVRGATRASAGSRAG